MATFEQAKQVKRKYSEQLLQCDGVCGLDVQLEKSGEAAINVHVDRNHVSVQKTLPKELDGVPVKCLMTGPFRKQKG